MNLIDISPRRCHTGLMPIVHQPTRSSNLLDQIIVSCLHYNIIQRQINHQKQPQGDHGALQVCSVCATENHHSENFQKKMPSQNAVFLQHFATLSFDNPEPTNNCHAEFDQFCATALQLFNHFYPQHTIAITLREPEYITADIKVKLHRKNRLMRAGQIEEADCLAEHIGKDTTKQSKT